MSSALANKISQIKAQQENPEETFNRTQFLQLIKQLELEYVLTDEEIYGIFDLTDNFKEGKLGVFEIFGVLDMILASEEEDGGKGEPKRGSIDYLRHSIRIQNNRLSSNTVNEIDIDTISELKHIYSICEGNKGYASLDQITEFIGNFKQLSSGSLGQLLKIFNCVKDSERNVVTREAFSNLMSKLEKAILNQFVEDYDNVNSEINIDSKGEIPEQKRPAASVYEQSEIGSDSEDEHSEEE